MTDKSPNVPAFSTRYPLLALLAVTLVARVAALGNPILYTDEEFYFAAGKTIANGAIPFVDIWDRKPIGLFLIYAVPGKLGFPLGIWLYQIMAVASVVSTAWLIARIAAKAGWERGSTMAGAAYALWVVFAGGQGGQSPIFYNALMALAALYILKAEGPKRRRNGMIGMSLVGLALQVKYSVVFEGIFFGLWLVHREWRQTGRVGVAAGWGAILAAAALMPTAAAALVYAGTGHLPEFVFANFHSILARNGDPIQEEVANILKAGLILAPLVMAALAGGAAKVPERTAVHGFLLGWLAVSLLAFAILPPWTFHYTLPVVLPACTLAAGFFSRPDRKVASFSLLLVAAIAGQVSLAINRAQRGTPHQFARLVDSVGRGPGCLYVYSSSSMLYPATGRCAVSRYVFPSHLTRAREAGAIGVDQASEIRHVFAAAPEVVVMGPPYDGERPEIRSLALELLAQSYRLAGQVKLGRKRVSIYRRGEPSRIPVRAVSSFG
jgi:hypothetical protein